MDLSLLLILMAVLYILPELFKRRRPKKYEYPEIPDPPRYPEPSAEEPRPPGYAEKMQYNIPVVTAFQEKTTVPKTEPTPKQAALPVLQSQSVSGGSVWQGSLNSSMILNGIIFAEIIQPPLAKRPLRQSPFLAKQWPGGK